MDTPNNEPSNMNLNLEENVNERIIELTVITLENIIKNEDINVIISIEHNSNILGESNPIKIEAGIKEPPPIYDVNFTVKIPIHFKDQNTFDLIVSNPILSKMFNYKFYFIQLDDIVLFCFFFVSLYPVNTKR
ncbi:hypothetical protein M0802_015640 [Mischocyttarus mexicanus]|nr:hypothetical protein M0802_015640 [Mischocyttarus mexicanus]